MRIFVKAKPGARQTAVKQLTPDHYVVSVTAIAEKGRANQAVRAALADYFDVGVSAITILRGQTSPLKTIDVQLSNE